MTLPVRALALFAIALSVCIPLSSRDTRQPYFALTSSQSFAPGTEPFIQLSAVDVNALRFRVYRINDPVQFMRQLGDAHQFGGRYANPHGKLTLLERIHQWKRALRRDIRYNLRAQFTEAPSRHLSFLQRTSASKNKAAYFAEAPVLNQQQLVLSFLQPVSPKENRWDTQQVKIPVKDKGVFLVEAVTGELRAYTMLAVSDIVLLTKTGRDHVLYYVANRTTGEPIPNASVTAVTRDASVNKLDTAQDGVAEFAIDRKIEDDLRVVAVAGRDAAFNDIESWFFGNRQRNLTGVVYTDRPVYRPGDTMHFRGILRYRQISSYSIPAGQSFSVQIMDRDGKPVYRKDLSANSYGIVHDDLTLAKDAPLGTYFIQITSGENTSNGTFEVQEYKKPEYEVHVTPAVPRLLQGQSTKVTIDARYYFGEPVTDAKVRYSVFRSRYWSPMWYDPDEQEDEQSNEPNDYGYNQQTSQQEGQLDSEGKLVINLDTRVTDDKSDTLYRIEAGVTDKAGREISGTGWLVATYGKFALNVEPDRWFYQPSDTANFKVQARDYDNQPVSTSVHLDLRSYNGRKRSTGETLAQADARTGDDGVGSTTLKLPDKGGSYLLISSAPSDDRIVETRTYLWISGPGEGGGADTGEGAGSVQIIPDKKTYKPGETARIMIGAGQDNTPVLVTVEGRDVRSHSLLRATGGSALFTYPINVTDEPALFVTAQFFRKGGLYQNTKRIKVPADDHKLALKMTTDKPQYQPGQSATYNIDVTSKDGKPAANADLSLSVVDEAIYAIVKDTTPDLLTTFYGRDYNSVLSENSLTYYFTGEAGTRRMRLAALRPSTRLAQLKPQQLVRPKVRKYFPDTAFWASDITTDAQGHARAQLTFPDSLTTWRATARASSLDDRYGSAVLKRIVRKNLIIRLAVPRFFIQGDEVVVSALVHNYLQNDKQAHVSVKLQGLDILSGSPTQTVTVPQRGEAKIDWRVKASRLAGAKIDAEALTDEESDALEIELPIHPPGVLIRDPHSGSISDSGAAHVDAAFPSDAVPGSRSLTIRLAPSVAGSIFSALNYLTSYPYGCVEQTMSSFLPDIVVTQAMHELNLKQPINESQLNEKIAAGLERLRGYRHEDGGWGWWVTDDSHPFMTAYVVAGLSQAQAAGVSVDKSEIDGGAKWTERYLLSHKNTPADLRGYMLYSLAVSGHLNRQILEQLYASRSDLSSYGLAFLGLTLESARDARASDIASQLEKKVTETGPEASWPASRDEMLDFTADVTPETTAYATKFLSKERPQSPLLPKAAVWLVNHRNEGYWWSSTKQTAMVIYGLIDYVKISHELNPSLKASVRVNRQAVGSAQFNSADVTAVSVITLDESKLSASGNKIEIGSSGSGRLYYSVSADHYSNDAKAQNQGTIALNILRDYYRLSPGSGTPIVYDLQPLDGAVSQGDVIAVRLTVTGSDWRYLLIEDPIPAGTEFVKDDKLYHLREAPPWWHYWFSERENHDDRIAIFDSYFYRRQTEYFYLLKVVNPGLFHVGPARVQPMYQPGYQATSGATTLEVR